MRETVMVNGVQLFAPVFACRPRNWDDVPADQLKIYRDTEMEAGLTLNIYPGSTFMPCETCSIVVAVGPRAQVAMVEAERLGLNAHVMCPIDAALYAHEVDPSEIRVADLGNPFKKKDS